jgi:hypothetical protein
MINSNHNSIPDTVEKIMSQLKPLLANYSWENPALYSQWLSQQYHIVRHSTPLLALSCGRSIDRQAYHKRCIEHLAEEKGHDKMLLNDLKATGFPLSEELPATRAYYSAQYYQVEHVNPVSFLGYILFMEALAISFGKEVSMKAAQGSKGISFLKLHSEEDEDHIQKAYQMIAQLSEVDQRDVQLNLKLSARSYFSMMQDLHSMKAESKFKKAA